MFGKCEKAETFDRGVGPNQSEFLQQEPSSELRRLAPKTRIRWIGFALRVYKW